MSAAAAANASAPAEGSSGPPSAKKEKKASDKDVDLSNCQRGVWLVKVPKYIHDRWQSAPEKACVGQLRIARKPGSLNVSLTLDDAVVAAKEDGAGGAKDPVPDDERNSGATKKPIPKEHKVVMSNISLQTLAVFSHTQGTQDDPEAVLPTPDKLAMEGMVVQRAECRPISNQVYMSLKKEALLKAIEPTRQTKQLDRAVNAYKPRANHVANIAYEARKKAEGKKARDDKDQVMERLFHLFEKHQYYNIKDLVKETRQPITYLKEILKEVCHYNLKNPHKNMWELKPEYRHYQASEADDGAKKNDSSSSDED